MRSVRLSVRQDPEHEIMNAMYLLLTHKVQKYPAALGTYINKIN